MQRSTTATRTERKQMTTQTGHHCFRGPVRRVLLLEHGPDDRDNQDDGASDPQPDQQRGIGRAARPLRRFLPGNRLGGRLLSCRKFVLWEFVRGRSLSGLRPRSVVAHTSVEILGFVPVG